MLQKIKNTFFKVFFFDLGLDERLIFTDKVHDISVIIHRLGFKNSFTTSFGVYTTINAKPYG